jgi:hypothetical protein
MWSNRAVMLGTRKYAYLYAATHPSPIRLGISPKLSQMRGPEQRGETLGTPGYFRGLLGYSAKARSSRINAHPMPDPHAADLSTVSGPLLDPLRDEGRPCFPLVRF